MKGILNFIKNYIKTKLTDTRTSSRKYKLVLLIFFAATIMCLFPPIISVFVFKVAPITILTGSEWISVMSLISGLYFGANVIQKKIAGKLYDNSDTVLPPEPALPPPISEENPKTTTIEESLESSSKENINTN